MHTNKSENIPQMSFTKHRKIKLKLRIFIALFLLGGLVILIGQEGFAKKVGNQNLLADLILFGMVIELLAVFWVSFFVRCPQCHTRVYSLKMMWNGKMPVGKINSCPVCEFPSKEIQTVHSNANAKSTKQSLASTIGVAILVGSFLGVFELGVVSFTFRSLIASIASGIALVLPFGLIRFYYGVQRGFKLFFVVIVSCVIAVMVWLLIDKSVELSLLSVGVMSLVLIVIFIFVISIETRFKIFK